MPRRSDHTKEQIRDLVVNAGQKIISESGYQSLSTRKIASEIGYTVGTLYHFFENYDDIILHINTVTLDDMRKFVKEGINQKDNGIDKVKKLAHLYIEFAHKEYYRWSALFEYKLSEKHKIPEWYAKQVGALFGIIEANISEYISDPIELKKHSTILWASIHGICIAAISNRLDLNSEASASDMADCLIENYLKALQN